jgi:hypothetical protein
MAPPWNLTQAQSSFSHYRAQSYGFHTPINHQILASGSKHPGTKAGAARFPVPDFPRASRQRGGFAMWTSLFAVTAIIAIALSMAAIVVDSVKGGKFRL